MWGTHSDLAKDPDPLQDRDLVKDSDLANLENLIDFRKSLRLSTFARSGNFWIISRNVGGFFNDFFLL